MRVPRGIASRVGIPMSRTKKPNQLRELWDLSMVFNRGWSGVPEKENDEEKEPGWDPNVSDELGALRGVNVLCRDGNRYM